MNYPDEDYVRFYTRDTITWLALEFEGQAVLSLMLHGRFNRSGIFDCGGHDPSHAVTLAIRCPREIAEKGVERLLATKTWVLNDGQLIWPNYVHAQHCKRSDRARKAESRANLALEALGQKSQPVTRGHTRSQPVTPKPKPKQKPKPRGIARERAPAPPSSETVPLAPEDPQQSGSSAAPIAPAAAAAAPAPSAPSLSLQERALLWVRDVFKASQVAPNPGAWPETVELQDRLRLRFGTTQVIPLKGHTDKRVAIPLARWAEGISQDQLLLAIDGAATDPYVRDQPGRQTVQFILREADAVNEFVQRIAKSKPISQPDKSNRVKLSPEAQETLRKRRAGEL